MKKIIHKLRACKPIRLACLCLLMVAFLSTAWADSVQRLDALNALDAALESAPDQDEIRTTLKLANDYIIGRNRDRNVGIGISLAKDVAEQGIPHAQFLLGMVYTTPELGHLDYDKAFLMLRRAAAQEFAPAYARLGDLYLRGHGTNADLAEAWRLFQQSAEGFDEHALEGKLGMGLMLLEGLHVDRDEARGMSLLLEAAEAGIALAEYTVGTVFAVDDLSGPADYNRAARWFERALDGGYFPAATALGMIHDEGLGRSEDAGTAAEYYRLAAQKDDLAALFNLASLYDSGRGVPRDQAKARELYARAEALGGPTAPLNLDAQSQRTEFPLQGYWYYSQADESHSLDEALKFELIAGDGRISTLINIISGQLYQADRAVRVELKDDIATYYVQSEDEQWSERVRFEDEDTVVLADAGDDNAFVMRRLPEDAHMLKAMLQLAMTGEVLEFGSVNNRHVFAGAHSFQALLQEKGASIIVSQFPDAPFSGMLRRDGQPWMAALDGPVVAIGEGGREMWPYLGQIIGEAARPISGDEQKD